MADDPQVLADLVKIVDANNAERNINDLLNDAPLLRTLYADMASNGTTHKYLKETGAPVVGFRTVNKGRNTDRSTDTQVSIDLEILAATFWTDYGLANANPKGPSAHIAREANRHLRAAFFGAEQQFLYGQEAGAADGFEGLADWLGLANGMTVDAQGSTASTGSSVFLVRTTPSLDDVTVITGADGSITIGETSVIEKADPDDATKSFPAYYTPIEGWLGLQVGGAYSAGRIANLTAQDGKGLTDDLIAEALSRFPASKMPTHLVMNRRSLRQLQQSRTATNATGAPAPFPTEAFGVPILPTDAIVSTEDILVEGT